MPINFQPHPMHPSFGPTPFANYQHLFQTRPSTPPPPQPPQYIPLKTRLYKLNNEMPYFQQKPDYTTLLLKETTADQSLVIPDHPTKASVIRGDLRLMGLKTRCEKFFANQKLYSLITFLLDNRNHFETCPEVLDQIKMMANQTISKPIKLPQATTTTPGARPASRHPTPGTWVQTPTGPTWRPTPPPIRSQTPYTRLPISRHTLNTMSHTQNFSDQHYTR